MQNQQDRRAFLRVLSSLFLAAALPLEALAKGSGQIKKPPGTPDTNMGNMALAPPAIPNGALRDNFKVIYSDPALAAEYKNFLVNVYHLYPEDKLHALIQECVKKSQAGDQSDREIYEELFRRIPEIKPLLNMATYGLPALAKQKAEMSRQTISLLGKNPVNGYVEIGTPGRYVKHLRREIQLNGPVHLVHDWEPGMSPADIAERGQLAKAGSYVPLDNYNPWPSDKIPDASVDVVSNFIGIHHSPRERLDGFVKSIHRVLRPGGRFVLRDHDANGKTMLAMVGLAHDVFNAGLGVDWQGNEKELRYFLPLTEIESYLSKMGFARTGETLYQSGDPSKNALMLFVKKA
jgi:hypothetical protein